MIALRKSNLLFGWGSFTWAEAGTESVAAYWRGDGSQRLLVLNNLSETRQPVSLRLPDGLVSGPVDLLTNDQLLLARRPG
jgi:glycosidase